MTIRTTLALAAVVVAGALGQPIQVPEDYPTIQEGINNTTTVRCTVSVWGPVGVPPPYEYVENIAFRQDLPNLMVVNRSFLPAGGTGYDSSWNHVIIDGSNQVGSVETMTGSESARTQKPPSGNSA